MMRPLFATFAALAAMFSLAGLYTQVLARDFIAAHVDGALLRAPPNLALIAAGYLLLSALMVMAYRRICLPTATPFRSGLVFGLCSAVAWLMPYSLVLFGAYRFPYAALPLDFAWALLEQGVGGVVIGLISGRAARPS